MSRDLCDDARRQSYVGTGGRRSSASSARTPDANQPHRAPAGVNRADTDPRGDDLPALSEDESRAAASSYERRSHKARADWKPPRGGRRRMAAVRDGCALCDRRATDCRPLRGSPARCRLTPRSARRVTVCRRGSRALQGIGSYRLEPTPAPPPIAGSLRHRRRLERTATPAPRCRARRSMPCSIWEWQPTHR